MLVNIMDLAIFRGKKTDYSNVDPNECPYLIVKSNHNIKLSPNTIYLKSHSLCTAITTDNLLYISGFFDYKFSINNKLLYIDGRFTTRYHKYLVYAIDYAQKLPDTVMYAILEINSNNENIKSMPYYMISLTQCYLVINDNIEYAFTLKYLQCIDISYDIYSIDNIGDLYSENIHTLLDIDVDNIIKNAMDALNYAIDLVDDINRERPSIIENKLRKHFDYKSMYISII